MTPEKAALVAILENQVKLADMIANPSGRTRSQLQDDANRMAVEAAPLIRALRGEDPTTDQS